MTSDEDNTGGACEAEFLKLTFPFSLCSLLGIFGGFPHFPRHLVCVDISDSGKQRLGWKERWPVYRWPGWECIGTSVRTFLPCPVGLGPLTAIGPIAAKSRSEDHSGTTEAGERSQRGP